MTYAPEEKQAVQDTEAAAPKASEEAANAPDAEKKQASEEAANATDAEEFKVTATGTASIRSKNFEEVLVVDEGGGATVARLFSVRWHVRVGGVVLALCAGIVNAVALHVLGTFVSHATGTLSKIGLGIEDSAIADAGTSCLLLLSFVTGSTLCGCFIGKGTIHFGIALYDFGLISVSILLLVATLCADSDKKLAAYFACCACGLQNGLATQWGTAILRTTHVTGLFTDVGLLVGRVTSLLVRRRCGMRLDNIDKGELQDDLSKLSVLLTIATGFFCGVLVGAILAGSMKEHAFLIPAGVTGIAGLSYSIYRVFVLHQHFFSAEEMDVVDLPPGQLSFQDGDGQEPTCPKSPIAPLSPVSPTRRAMRIATVGTAHRNAAVVTVTRDAISDGTPTVCHTV